MINKLKKIYKKNEEVINYIIVGGLTTLISLISYYLCVLVILNPFDPVQLQIANIISWIISVTFAYFTNRKYVFKSNENNKFNEAIKFFVSRLSTLCIDMLCMFVFVTIFSINDKISKLIVQIIVFILNYLLSKFLVFKKKVEKNRKEGNKLKYCKYTITIVLFVFIYSILIPYGGDDWGNFLNGSTNISNIINIVKSFYLSWEGRIISRFFCLLIIPRPILFAFINSILFGLFYHFLTKILNADKNPILYPIIFISLFFIDMETYSQIYIWKTGNITYFIPIVFLFFLIFKRLNIFENKEIKKSKYEILIIPLSFIFSLFVENITVGIISVLLMNIIFYYINKRKIDKIMLLSLIFSVIAFLIMVLSPGNANRLNMDVDFNNLSIIGKILYNIPNLIKYTYIKNSFLLILILLILIIYIYIYKSKINNFLKIISYLFLSIIPIITIVIYNFNIFIKLPNILLLFLDVNKIYVCIYWIIFTFILITILIKISIKTNFKRNIYFIILALIGNGSMMLSPVWGGRTASLTTFSLIVLSLFILMDYKIISSKLNIMFKIFMYFFVFLFTIYSVFIFILNKDREKYINYQIKNSYQEYEVIILPSYFTWNLNTWGSDGEFAYNFKKAYGINKEAELKYVKRRNIDLSILK